MNAGFMLDTSAINRICDERVDAALWTLRGRIYVTDIQIQELARTPEPARRSALLRTLSSLRISIIRPGVAARHGDGYDIDESTYPSPPLGRVLPIIAASLGRRFKRQYSDATIAETAIANDLTLVTADVRLGEVARAFGAAVEAIP